MMSYMKLLTRSVLQPPLMLVDCVVALSVASLNGCVSVVPSVSASSILLSSSMMSALPPRFLNACHWLQKASEQQRDDFDANKQQQKIYIYNRY